MKLRYILALCATALFINSQLVAQSYVESALLFSRTKPGGSARIQALGGSQIALGGDYSSIYSNPAGLGMYNRSEFSITPAFSSFGTDASYFGNSKTENTSRFQLPGLGFVFNKRSEREGAFVGGSFGISLNRMNDFNRSITYQNTNPNSSIIEYFIDQANGATTAQFDPDGPLYNDPVGLAYHNFLIGAASTLDPTYPNDEYFTDVQKNFENIQSDPNQREEIETSGAMNQWSFSYGANFLDKIFVGGGIGVGSIKYKSTKTFMESFDVDPNFNSLVLEENLDIKGSGINATIGAIVRPIDIFQIGISYTTPTFYQLSETYDATLSTSWNNFDYYGKGERILNNESAFTDIVTSEYNLTVPSKFSVGIALISKIGFLTSDIELINPANAKYSSDTEGTSFGFDNDDIKSFYQRGINYRVGAEYRYDIYRVRAGYAIQSSTYKRERGDNQTQSISGGLGVRLKNFYIDFSLIHTKGDNLYQPYNFSYGGGPVVDLENRYTSGMITLGFTY